jgi:3-dehydroquinate dehydratase (EC 4.2.1.10)
MSILLINGPNLNLLGQREPQVYGTDTLADIEQRVISLAAKSEVVVECFQSNIEGVLIDKIHEAASAGCQLIIINPGAFTHTSIALRDALLGVNIPCIEVHLSNVYKREAFRQVSYLSDIAIGVITGLGAKGYDYALNYAIDEMKKS